MLAFRPNYYLLFDVRISPGRRNNPFRPGSRFDDEEAGAENGKRRTRIALRKFGVS